MVDFVINGATDLLLITTLNKKKKDVFNVFSVFSPIISVVLTIKSL